MPKQKSKIVPIVGKGTSEFLQDICFFGPVLLLPVSAIGLVTWVIVSATTPDVLSLSRAIALGALIGFVTVAVSIGIGLHMSGDAFPDFICGFVIPCGAIIILSCIMQPVADRMTKHRLKTKQPPIPAQVQHRATLD